MVLHSERDGSTTSSKSRAGVFSHRRDVAKGHAFLSGELSDRRRWGVGVSTKEAAQVKITKMTTAMVTNCELRKAGRAGTRQQGCRASPIYGSTSWPTLRFR